MSISQKSINKAFALGVLGLYAFGIGATLGAKTHEYTRVIGDYKLNNEILPQNSVSVGGVNTTYSPYYDDTVQSLVSYNADLNINFDSASDWNYDQSYDEYYIMLGYDYNSSSLVNINRHLTQEWQLYHLANNGLLDYDFIIYASYDNNDSEIDFFFYYNDQTFVFNDTEYKTDRLNIILTADTSISYSWEGYCFSSHKTFSNQSLDFWCSSSIPHSTISSLGTNSNFGYYLNFAQLHMGLESSLFNVSYMFFMEWLVDDSEYKNGYNAGYTAGVSDGKNYVLTHLNEFDLYDYASYIAYGQSQYNAGLEAGSNVLSLSGVMNSIFTAPISMFMQIFRSGAFVWTMPTGEVLDLGGLMTFFLTIGIAIAVVRLIMKVGGK